MNSAPQDVNTSLPNQSPATAAPVWIKRGTPEYWRVSVALFLAGFATFAQQQAFQRARGQQRMPLRHE